VDTMMEIPGEKEIKMGPTKTVLSMVKMGEYGSKQEEMPMSKREDGVAGDTDVGVAGDTDVPATRLEWLTKLGSPRTEVHLENGRHEGGRRNSKGRPSDDRRGSTSAI